MKSIKSILESELKDNEASYAEYLTLVEFAKPYEGKRITRAIGNKLPAGYKLQDDLLGNFEIVAPSGRKHSFIRKEDVNEFTLQKFADFNPPYAKGAPERIEKLKAILDSPKKLKKCEEYFEGMKKAYDDLKKFAKKSDDEFGSYENPAYYSILDDWKIGTEIISDLRFDNDLKMEKGGSAGRDFTSDDLRRYIKDLDSKEYNEFLEDYVENPSDANEVEDWIAKLSKADLNKMGMKVLAGTEMEKGGKAGGDLESIYKKYADKDYWGYNHSIKSKKEERDIFANRGDEKAKNTTDEQIESFYAGLQKQNFDTYVNRVKKALDEKDKDWLGKNLRANQKLTMELVEFYTGQKAGKNQSEINAWIDKFVSTPALGKGGRATHQEGGINWLITG